MSSHPVADRVAISASTSGITLRRIAIGRAALALAWAAALVIAVGDRVPTTQSDLPLAAAALLSSYPVIDAIASVLAASLAGSSRRVLLANAAVSGLAAVAIGVAAFGSDAGATLAAFGVWAAVSGALQFAVAVNRRRTEGRQLPMLVSGALSMLAGLGFLMAARSDDANVAILGAYMALGGVLYLVSARRSRATGHAGA